ncbi:dTDP-4-dehydrorhamnose 3,5-epimerase [Methylopila sp. Yamaguchi]|uniref:dTDP-4-dehydrorhamnose 3,5-epimerase n=1 Tax=Methylopila sp. Yamaguchi TaxID=1437817 RepID=UPI000CBE2A83|nr:dTDP-4-dehydrorhamnose 3,5-epimerase [Methylopila sp. Yamaguchi]GBD50486.1 dTDP-4-dehydrorhamnose 3,5-epimerase [Methylopila sp. Yamaguchi]
MGRATAMKGRMRVERTDIAGLIIITPPQFRDDRGALSETWSKRRLAEAGVALPEFVQDNRSLSPRRWTLRGMHYQAPPHAQGKLVRCGRGRFFDVAVDVRTSSATYGRSFGIELSADNGLQLYIPEGFLHGLLTLEDDTEALYKCTADYAPDAQGAVRWDSCGVDWPVPAGVAPLTSPRDAEAQALAAFVSPFA